MSARRRARRGCCSASAAPITAWTSRRAACWCRPIASKCWNAAPRSAPSPIMRRTRRPARTGALDVLAQHVLGAACGEPFLADELFAEVRSAAPYAGLARADFDAVLDFVATGGYALKAYERFAKIRQGQDGRWRVSHPMIAQRYRTSAPSTRSNRERLQNEFLRARRPRSARPIVFVHPRHRRGDQDGRQDRRDGARAASSPQNATPPRAPPRPPGRPLRRGLRGRRRALSGSALQRVRDIDLWTAVAVRVGRSRVEEARAKIDEADLASLLLIDEERQARSAAVASAGSPVERVRAKSSARRRADASSSTYILRDALVGPDRGREPQARARPARPRRRRPRSRSMSDALSVRLAESRLVPARRRRSNEPRARRASTPERSGRGRVSSTTASARLGSPQPQPLRAHRSSEHVVPWWSGRGGSPVRRPRRAGLLAHRRRWLTGPIIGVTGVLYTNREDRRLHPAPAAHREGKLEPRSSPCGLHAPDRVPKHHHRVCGACPRRPRTPAAGSGSTDNQMLRKVEVPLAAPENSWPGLRIAVDLRRWVSPRRVLRRRRGWASARSTRTSSSKSNVVVRAACCVRRRSRSICHPHGPARDDALDAGEGRLMHATLAFRERLQRRDRLHPPQARVRTRRDPDRAG